MDIPQQYKQLWSNWDVRVLILLSLFIQIILIFLGRMRRTFNSRLIRMILWSSYLLADWVAAFVLGKLSNSMDESSASNAIIAFWAPFLILHLGGPDTITAYSKEDNELWARHLVGLIYQLIIAFYVLIRSLPNTHLLAPTLLMFVVAIIKYVERSYSLYKASIKGFPNTFSSYLHSAPTTEDLKILSEAFWLYSNNRPLFINAIPGMVMLNQTNAHMNDLSIREILRVMHVELSYAYEEFYTKAIVSHSKVGFFVRVLGSICIWSAFSLFVMAPKGDFKNIDVAITYVLLIASICLDVVAAVMLLFSNRMLVSILYVEKLNNLIEWFADRIFRIKRAFHKRRHRMIKIPQLNLLINCLAYSTTNKGPTEWIMNWVREKVGLVRVIRLESYIVGKEFCTLQPMQPVKANKKFMGTIFRCLRRRLLLKEEALKKPAGFSALQKVTTITEWAVPTFVQLFEGMPLDRQVLVWHIATELCLHCDLEPQYNHLHQAEIDVNEIKSQGEMETCKYLSDYMMHIVLFQSDMVSTMGGESLLYFVDALTEMNVFIRDNDVTKADEFCKKIMHVPIDWSWNALFETSKILTHLMLFIVHQDRWRIMITAWVDLLINWANNMGPSMHVKQLSRRDELLTFVWLFYKQASGFDLIKTDLDEEGRNNRKFLYHHMKDLLRNMDEIGD